jgi:hypothetical protein
MYTSCIGGSVLVASGNISSTCGPLSTCKTDFIYQTAVAGVATQVLYCETGLDSTWFRSMPTPGIGTFIHISKICIFRSHSITIACIISKSNVDLKSRTDRLNTAYSSLNTSTPVPPTSNGLPWGGIGGGIGSLIICCLVGFCVAKICCGSRGRRRGVGPSSSTPRHHARNDSPQRPTASEIQQERHNDFIQHRMDAEERQRMAS